MNIALIAHDNKKDEIVQLVNNNRDSFGQHVLFATGTTGGRLAQETGLNVTCLNSGPLGGDQQIGAMASVGEIDMIIFLRDPLTAQPHEPDVSALIRLADVCEIPLATNKATAHILIDSLI